MPKAELTTVVTPRCQALADRMNLELVDVCLDKEGAGKYLRIYIDKPEGISLDDCEAYHRAIQPQLEQYDYDFLEVSSPGICEMRTSGACADDVLQREFPLRPGDPAVVGLDVHKHNVRPHLFDTAPGNHKVVLSAGHTQKFAGTGHHNGSDDSLGDLGHNIRNKAQPLPVADADDFLALQLCEFYTHDPFPPSRKAMRAAFPL